jgi:membrane protein implicated in regulation of membrane protease activity
VRILAVAAFFTGLLLAVRVMFFGLQRKDAGDQLRHRRWPLALAAFLTAGGASLYASPGRAQAVTPMWMFVVVLAGLAAAAGAWWLVKRSAETPSSDPEDDPRYRFQGHVARIIRPIEQRGAEGEETGRISFHFDGTTHELDARWSPEAGSFERQLLGRADNEVVIERVEGDVAFVEPWAVVEERL